MKPLDGFDRKILEIVQADNKTTTDVIADRVGLSAAAVQRRLKGLRRSGVIWADVALVTPKALDRPMTFIVEVALERERLDLLDAFKRAVRAMPEVQQCYYVTGDADFVLVVTARDMTDYEAFTRRVFFDNPNIRRFHTNVVMEPVKVGLAVPVDASPEAAQAGGAGTGE